MKEIFTEIFEKNEWRCAETVSGAGSSLEWTQNLRRGLPILLRGLGVETFLDVPCGDFNWAKTVDWSDINYIGGDIVEELVNKNKQYETAHPFPAGNIKFINVDLSKDSLPEADIILVRDCLMHMSVDDVNKCLENVFKSKIKYLLCSTYPQNPANELTHKTSAHLRRYNLEIHPFKLNKPILYLNDSNKRISKLLGLWKI